MGTEIGTFQKIGSGQPAVSNDVLLQVTLALSSSLRGRELLRVFAQVGLECAGSDRSTILLARGAVLEPSVAIARERDEVLWAWFRSMPPIRLDSETRARLARHRVVPIEDATVDPIVPGEWVRRFSLRSLVLVPLMAGGDPSGVLALDWLEPRTFDRQDLEVVEALRLCANRMVDHGPLGAHVVSPGRVARVLVVGASGAGREGLAGILGTDREIDVVGAADSIEDAEKALERLQVDVVVLDYPLQTASGTDGCAHLATSGRRPTVVAVSNVPTETLMRRALESGARGFVAEQSSREALRVAVRSVATGGVFIEPSLAGRLVAPAIGPRVVGQVSISRSEQRVLGLMADGFSNRAISSELDVSIATVKTHVQHILRKLDVSNRVDAVVVARRGRLI